jgi:hypothetical protein
MGEYNCGDFIKIKPKRIDYYIIGPTTVCEWPSKITTGIDLIGSMETTNIIPLPSYFCTILFQIKHEKQAYVCYA